MTKRTTISNNQETNKRKKTSAGDLTDHYVGYRIVEKIEDVDCINVPNSEDEIKHFFNEYVLKRKPCKIIGQPADIDWSVLNPQSISESLGNDVLQIEKKFHGGFGSGRKRINMSFHEFMDRLFEGETELYLTTQYGANEEEGSADANSFDSSLDTSAHSISSNEDVVDERNECTNNQLDSCCLENAVGTCCHSNNSNDDDCNSCSVDSINFDDMHDDFEEMNGDCAFLQDAEERVKELYQPPMNRLVNVIPEQLPFLNLIPQQINIWIGSSNASVDDSFLENFDPKQELLGLGRNVPGGGSSSGLHHDHADNIYIPISGKKRFTIFSPADATKMYTVGSIENVHNTGIINYCRNEAAPTWKKLRADGSIQELYEQYELEKKNICWEQNSVQEEDADSSEILSCMDNSFDPPSFSEIPPSVIHLDKIENEKLRQNIQQVAEQRWKRFFEANRISLDIKPGEMLYMPTGWFHEVTSFGSEKPGEYSDNIHVAVNYWLFPPTGKSIDQPYVDSYWSDDFKETLSALRIVRENT